MTAVVFDRVTLGYGRRTVLKEISFAIRANEFVGVFGPNGCGKTTLLRAILGLVAPQDGRIAVLGETVRRGNPAIGYMPQLRRPLGELRLSAEDFIAGGLNGHRWGLPLLGSAGRGEVRRALDLVEAGTLARRPLSELSGGERQRVLLAQSLLGRPRLLLLDEPLVSLDLRYQASIVALVRRVQQELGIAVLFIAHELNPLLGSLDRVLYLGTQRAEIGTVESVVTGPVLSRLYGTPIEVAHLDGRIFVLSGAIDIQRVEQEHHATGRHAAL